jgi:hypothetical protein
MFRGQATVKLHFRRGGSTLYCSLGLHPTKALRAHCISKFSKRKDLSTLFHLHEGPTPPFQLDAGSSVLVFSLPCKIQLRSSFSLAAESRSLVYGSCGSGSESSGTTRKMTTGTAPRVPAMRMPW